MDRYEYMKIPLAIFPKHVEEQYELEKHAKGSFIYLEIRRTIYGLPQAGSLSNKALREFLAPHGYYEVAHTPCLWKHTTRPIQFTLVVDDFGVKYVGRQHAEHLIATLKKGYQLAVDWTGNLYCGICLEWNYEEHYLDIGMPGYIEKLRKRFQHELLDNPQLSPYEPPPKKYGKNVQEPIAEDKSPELDEK